MMESAFRYGGTYPKIGFLVYPWIKLVSIWTRVFFVFLPIYVLFKNYTNGKNLGKIEENSYCSICLCSNEITSLVYREFSKLENPNFEYM